MMNTAQETHPMPGQPVVGPRPLHVIAREIRADWKPVYYAAKPFVEAMGSLNKITDTYMSEDAEGIVLRFLSNAGTWRGETARRVKKELNDLLKRR